MARHSSHRRVRVVGALLIVAALFAAGCGDDDETSGSPDTEAPGDSGGDNGRGENTASDTGVTADSIKIAIVAADLSGLVKAGALPGLPENAHELNEKRYSYYFDKWNAEGGIHGRTIEYDLITWDPADPTSFDTACSEITLDYKPFLVVNPGGGYLPDAIPCITADGDTFFGPYQDPVSISTFEQSGPNLVTLAPPSEVLSEAGAEFAIAGEHVPEGAKIALVGGDSQFQKDSADRAKAVFEEAGFDVVYSDPVAVNVATTEAIQNMRLLVPKLEQAGADHVVAMLAYGLMTPFSQEADKSGLDVDYTIIEMQSGMCYSFAASLYPAEMDGATCVTSFDNNRIDDQLEPQEDSEFEAICRTEYEEAQGFETTVGVPFAGLTDVDGTRYNEDQSYFDCGAVKVLKQALENAGPELTKQSLYDAFLALEDFELAGISDGKGGFGPGKPFAATSMHAVRLVANDPEQKKGADGLYGKCLIPRNCFQVITPDEWQPITATLGD
jgi:hypothetical protein